MIGPYFSFNGELRLIEQAQVSLDNLSFLYGYGVYENLKVRNHVLFFPEMHIQRLLHSAGVIELPTKLTSGRIKEILDAFVQTMQVESYNLKMLLMGNELGSADLYIFASNPKYITEKDYRDGVSVITYNGERLFPQAKTLNMLMSFLAYKKAQENRAHDALLVDNDGVIREGTRTNLFFTDGVKIFTSPKEKVLEGVTKLTLVEALKKKGIIVVEKDLLKKDLSKYKGFFMTSTSAKVLPISKIDGKNVAIPAIVRDVMKIYDDYLDEYAQKQHSHPQNFRTIPRGQRASTERGRKQEVQHDTKHGSLGI